MSNLKRALRLFAKTKIGIYLRNFFNIHPASMNLRYSEVASDLFLWRDTNIYDNYFDLSHLGPILNPFYTESYIALIVAFDSDGGELARHEVRLIYGDANLLYINDIIGEYKRNCKGGTFAIFHLVDLQKLFEHQKICVAERGIVSYRLKSDVTALATSVHGNANAIGCNPHSKAIRLLGCFQKKTHHYRCQLNLNDALYTELFFVNFLSVNLDVIIYEYGVNGKINTKKLTLKPGGLEILDSRYDFNSKSIIEFESHLNFLRPVIFKHFTNHFDVLHG